MKATVKLTRKLQLHIDSKIRHALATSQPLMIPQSSTTGTQPKPEADKANGNGADHSR
jgi:hypothetical protein